MPNDFEVRDSSAKKLGIGFVIRVDNRRGRLFLWMIRKIGVAR